MGAMNTPFCRKRKIFFDSPYISKIRYYHITKSGLDNFIAPVDSVRIHYNIDLKNSESIYYKDMILFRSSDTTVIKLNL